jgi:hypothetical protein
VVPGVLLDEVEPGGGLARWRRTRSSRPRRPSLHNKTQAAARNTQKLTPVSVVVDGIPREEKRENENQTEGD